jgi:hypothetical protein
LHVCSSYELQSVAEKSAAEGASPEYEVIPAFSEANNPTVQSNIAYGTIQLPELNNHGPRGDKKIPAMQESINIVTANLPQDSGSVKPSTQARAYETNREEESAYDEI